MNKKKYILTFLLIAVVLSAYQNCGKVEITPQVSKLSLSKPSINGFFCQTRLAEVSPEWSLRKFLIVNMTAVYDLNGKLISNDQVISMQQLNGGEPLTTNLSLLNTDTDFLPNFLENYFGTDFSRDDMGWDYTGESTVAEILIQRGLNPRVITSKQSQDIVSYTYQRINTLDASTAVPSTIGQCPDGGSLWFFDFEKYISVSLAKSQVNLTESAFAHAKDENVFLLLVISENTAREYKYSYKIIKINHGGPGPHLQITPEMFTDIED